MPARKKKKKTVRGPSGNVNQNRQMDEFGNPLNAPRAPSKKKGRRTKKR